MRRWNRGGSEQAAGNRTLPAATSARARGTRRGGKEADSEKAATPGDCLGTGGPGVSSEEKLGGVVSAAEMSAAMKRILAKRMAEMNAGVEKDFAE